MQQKIIVSVDFGSKKLSASMAVKNEQQEIEILGVKSCKSTGIEKGLVKDIKKCRNNMCALLKELEEKTKRGIDEVAIGISARKVRITESSVKVSLEEKVRSEDIIKALKLSEKSITISKEECVIDVVINFYILDGKVIYNDVLNWKGKELELNLTLVIGQTKEIQKYYEIFKETKYKIEFFKLNVLEGKQIFLNDDNLIGDIVLVDVGAGNTEMAILSNGIPKKINSIPLGGNNISNDLAICGEFSFLEAENIKKIYSSNYKTLYNDNSVEEMIEVGALKVSKNLFYEVVNARIEEILNHINIDLKNTSHYDRICSIILYGDGLSYFEDINEIVDRIFKKKVKVIKKTDLGIKHSENITSLAIAKEVYDRLNLLGYNSKVQVNNNDEEEKISKIETSYKDEVDSHILKKLKVFLGKIF